MLHATGDKTVTNTLLTKKIPADVSVALPVYQPSVQRVELVDLLTDVAGVMREKFQCKQYFNLCYSVNRDSKQVFINILPSCS